jgi:hypothetical protein
MTMSKEDAGRVDQDQFRDPRSAYIQRGRNTRQVQRSMAYSMIQEATQMSDQADEARIVRLLEIEFEYLQKWNG